MACCHRMHLNTNSISSKRIQFPFHNISKKNGVTSTPLEGNSHIQLLSIYMSNTCSYSSEGQSPRKSGKLKASKSLRNNVNLRQELQDFIFAAGLPSDAVPSYKELSLHGRQDLANIVRRRGYKAIAQLLTEPQDICSTENAEKNTYGSPPMNLEEFNGLESSQSVESSNGHLHANIGTSDGTGNFQEQTCNLQILYSQNTWSLDKLPLTTYEADAVHLIKSNSSYTSKSSSMSLRERAANFVRTGDFHNIEGECESEGYHGDEETNKNTCKDYEVDDVLPSTPCSIDVDKYPAWPAESNSSVPSISGQSVVTKAAYKSYSWNDRQLTSATMDGTKQTAFWISEEQPFSREDESESFHRIMRDSLQLNGDGIPESTGSKQTLMELQHFNSVLQLKELELAKLKQELEEEKAKLYSLQAKAMAEVAHAQQILSDKESELNAADQALSGLKQVRIDYWGEGTNVEVTGSFNGWQHHISLEPDLTTEIRNSKGVRGPLIWSTELWLYPGIYEIKFIVDGIWQVDFRRSIVTRDMFQNNILKVEN